MYEQNVWLPAPSDECGRGRHIPIYSDCWSLKFRFGMLILVTDTLQALGRWRELLSSFGCRNCCITPQNWEDSLPVRVRIGLDRSREVYNPSSSRYNLLAFAINDATWSEFMDMLGSFSGLKDIELRLLSSWRVNEDVDWWLVSFLETGTPKSGLGWHGGVEWLVGGNKISA